MDGSTFDKHQVILLLMKFFLCDDGGKVAIDELRGLRCVPRLAITALPAETARVGSIEANRVTNGRNPHSIVTRRDKGRTRGWWYRWVFWWAFHEMLRLWRVDQLTIPARASKAASKRTSLANGVNEGGNPHGFVAATHKRCANVGPFL
jgi:hypothetical protein